jgi:hypothetical protein
MKVNLPDPLAQELNELHAVTGFKRLNPIWAKLEILFGLACAALGMIFALNLSHRADATVQLSEWLAPTALFILGFYLALAGHRSHLYQSQNKLAAYLAGLIRSTTPEARP